MFLKKAFCVALEWELLDSDSGRNLDCWDYVRLSLMQQFIGSDTLPLKYVSNYKALSLKWDKHICSEWIAVDTIKSIKDNCSSSITIASIESSQLVRQDITCDKCVRNAGKQMLALRKSELPSRAMGVNPVDNGINNSACKHAPGATHQV